MNRDADATILVTGGGSGIGAGLASAFHARGATVIIAGRSAENLAAVAARHEGMETEIVDVSDAGQVAALATRIAQRHPTLDTVINNAGIQTEIDFASDTPIDPAVIGREVDINLKGLIFVTNALLPLLKLQKRARLINIGSGLGYVPLATVPIYSATKAAVHSFSISLRRQLVGSSVDVIEIIPLVVETNLHRRQSRQPPNAMSLETFVSAAMAGLDACKPEIAVGLAKVLRTASRVVPSLFLKIVNKRRD